MGHSAEKVWIKMILTMTNARRMLARIQRLWSYLNEGPQQEWDRVYLCSVAPMSAGALRVNEEAERTHAPR